jgi:hypothetical protein
VRLLALTILFSAAAVYEGVHLPSLVAPDVWVHLRTGIWILQNHSVPHTGLFSQYSNQSWIDSSWLFDVVLAGAYHLFGLRAIPILLMLLKALLALVTFVLARAGRVNFWAAIVLSAIAQYVIPDLQPLPYVFSILFFAIELYLMLRSRETGAVRCLYWLPLLFVFWANLHIQFVTGLVLLALFLGVLAFEHSLCTLGVGGVVDEIPTLSLRKVGAIGLLSFLGTFATPYTFHLLPAVSKTLYSDVSFEYFSEMSAMSFRRPQEYVLMLMAMAAFLALGRRRSFEPFKLIILVAGTAVGFRFQRDAWMAILPAIAVLSYGLAAKQGESESPRIKDRQREGIWAASLAVAVLMIAGARLPDQNALMSKISQSFPMKACDYIRDNRLPQPLFNTYTWGGFLTWYMPQYPVAVDNRVELYGDETLISYFKVISGKEPLDSDPTLAQAGTLLLDEQSAMAKALKTLPALSSQYRLVYNDDVASVFVRQ